MIENRNVYLDVETIPSQARDAFERARARISAPSNYKDPEKIAAYVNEKADEAYRKTSLDGSYGELLMIGFAFGDGEPRVLARTIGEGLEGERRILQEFWSVIDHHAQANPLWVGHYVASFDLRFLFKRSIIQRVRATRTIRPDYKPWSNDVADTSYLWTGEANQGIKLDELASILNLPSPKDILDGSEVFDAALRGEYDAIANYNMGDVRTVREIYRLIGSLDIGYEE